MTRCVVMAWLLCAWVLWEKSDDVRHGQPSWYLQTAFSTEAACGERAEIKYHGTLGAFRTTTSAKVTALPDRTFMIAAADGRLTQYAFVCLPDTVDPRAPKR